MKNYLLLPEESISLTEANRRMRAGQESMYDEEIYTKKTVSQGTDSGSC